MNAAKHADREVGDGGELLRPSRRGVLESLATANVHKYFEQKSIGQVGRSKQKVDPVAEVLSNRIWPP